MRFLARCLLFLVVVAMVGCDQCDRDDPTAPSVVSSSPTSDPSSDPAPNPTASPPVRHPGPGESGWDMLSFMLNTSDLAYGYAQNPFFSAVATFLVESNRYIGCKFGGCYRHVALHFDDTRIYLDEDHSMNGNVPWNVTSNPRPLVYRHWQVGGYLTANVCLDWPGDGTCRVLHGCHNATYRVTFTEFVRDFDFGGDVGIRDAIVLELLPHGGPNQTEPEISVYGRGVGQMFWTGPEHGAGPYHPNWREGPFKNVAVPKARWNPAEAHTCYWEGIIYP